MAGGRRGPWIDAGETPVTDDEKSGEKKLGKELNNLVWQLLQKDRTEEDDQRMIHAAHASCYHWSIGGTVVNISRGEWLISHAYAVLGRSEPALHHARRCFQICKENEIGDFDIAYAYEGLARALAAAGQKAEADRQLVLAREAGGRIAEEEDRDMFFQDLKSGPWYGLA